MISFRVFRSYYRDSRDSKGEGDIGVQNVVNQ